MSESNQSNQSNNQNQSEPEQINIVDAVREFLSKNRVKILIATPCFGGLLHSGYLQSIVELSVNFTKLNIPFEIITIGNESLITRARNGIVAKFMGNDDLTHLMFIDADITFPWFGIVRLLLADKDVAGGCYPKKSINWEKVKRTVTKNPNIEQKELIARSVDYVFNPVYYTTTDGQLVAQVENGLVRVKDVATGFMLIKKNVFTTLKYKYPELKYKNNVAGYHVGNSADNFYNLFDTDIDDESRVYLSEDYLFCKRWRNCGGDLWLDLSINLNHTGSIDYVGCLGMNIGQVDDLNQDTVVTGNTIQKVT